MAPFFGLAATRGVYWQFGTKDPAGFHAAHGWLAEVKTFDEVGRRFGRWPPPGVSGAAARRAGAASRSTSSAQGVPRKGREAPQDPRRFCLRVIGSVGVKRCPSECLSALAYPSAPNGFGGGGSRRRAAARR